MKFLRSVVIIFGFSFFGIGAFFIGFLVFPFIRLFIPEDKRKSCYSSVIYNSWKFFINLLQTLKVLKININNKEQLTRIKSKIIVATHPSFIDVIILMAIIPNSTCFAKKELMNPLLKNIINSFFISSDLDIEELKIETKNWLDAGFNVIVFPSGIRHRKNEFPKIRKGSALVAINSGKNIVPIQMYNDRDFLQIGQPFYDASDRTVNYCITPLDEINISDYISEDEVDSRKNITKAISDSLYDYVE